MKTFTLPRGLAPACVALLALAGCAVAPQPPAPVRGAVITTPPPAAQDIEKDAARRAEFDAALGRWHGAPVAELKTKLGKPTSMTRRADGSTVYAYTRNTPADLGTGYSRFTCTVSYVVDEKSQRVRSHSMSGC